MVKPLVDRLRLVASECGQSYCAEAADRITELEADRDRLWRVMHYVAHKASVLGTGTDGYLRGRIMSISNELNAAIGLGQSIHGDQYDER